MNYYLSEQQKRITKKASIGIFSSKNEGAEDKKNRPLLSIIVPVYNESEVIERCHNRLDNVAQTLPLNVEIIYVNDGSTDDTLTLLHALSYYNNRISIIDLSRNFGKEIAMTAGLDHARGDAVILIDADLQDPPELIPEMVAEWQRGYDVVYMKRASRRGESWLKKITAYGFYRIINRISHIEIPQGVGDFRLLSRRAVDSVCQLRESNRFMKGLFAWLGYKQKELLYNRDERAEGKSKWSYPALWNLAIEGITSFSIAPLKLASYLGLLCLTAFVLLGMWLGAEFIVYQQAPTSMSLLSTGLLLFAGVQMMLLGVIGEYLGRMYMETKKRPLYLVNDWQKADIDAQDAAHSSDILKGCHLS
jgi:polyisoprenyl-phosphate glycosyltransferase